MEAIELRRCGQINPRKAAALRAITSAPVPGKLCDFGITDINKTSKIKAILFRRASILKCFPLMASLIHLFVDIKGLTRATNILYFRVIKGCYILDRGLK